jgi:hypothetical protein
VFSFVRLIALCFPIKLQGRLQSCFDFFLRFSIKALSPQHDRDIDDAIEMEKENKKSTEKSGLVDGSDSLPSTR